MSYNKIALQPTGNKDARQHYVDTIENSVDLDRIKRFISPDDFSRLKSMYPNNEVRIWGVTPGSKNINKRKWEKLSIGDITLFYQNKKLFTSGVISFKLHNPNLARHLWGVDNQGNTWEYIYFVDEIKHLDIDIEDFNKVVGYSEHFIVQGFNVLDFDKSNRIFDNLLDESEKYVPEYDEADLEETVNELEALSETDTQGLRSGRKEQHILRRLLFGEKLSDECAICGKEYPVELLVAAHIKKRKLCTEAEKKDRNIVVGMCKFGCDDLFEKGYIVVDEGILRSNYYGNNANLLSYISNIEGKTISQYGHNREQYFDFHLNMHRK